MPASYMVLGSLLSASSSRRVSSVVSGISQAGHDCSGSVSQVGPFHHKEEFSSYSTVLLLVEISAGFSLEAVYR